MIGFECSHCGRNLKVKDFAFQKGKCPFCGLAVVVGAARPVTEAPRFGPVGSGGLDPFPPGPAGAPGSSQRSPGQEQDSLPTPASLLEQLGQPLNQEAWNRFVHLYTPLLFAFASRVGLQQSDAADLVQDVFMLLVQKLPEFAYDRRKSFRGWLRKVTLNKWRENYRRRCGPQFEANPVPLAELAGSPAADAFWEAEYHRNLARQALELMQAEFQPTTWKACLECVVSGRPAAEVATELGISVGAVRAAKFRVLCRLRHELQGLFD